MNGAASDAVDRVARVAISGLQAERSFTLPSGSVQCAPPTSEFVTDY